MTNDVLKQIWPEWEIEETPLGRGSFGVVYKAVRKDHNVESYAAIKVISIPSDPSEVDSLRSEGMDINATKTFLHNIVDDFVNEIQLMESLKGVQNIVSVEDYKVVEKNAEIGWDIYIRMELLTPFNKYTCDKKLTEKEVIKLGCDICTALEICGKRNIIHRDIKPENIFINDFGDFKLGDFGIARKLENMTGGLSQKGTFNYMAPEVATGSKYDSRVDTYSLGIVLYRLLNGNRLPFLDTEKQLLNPNERRNAVDRRLQGEAFPPPFEASPEMADVILRACAYDPNKRFSSATEMKHALMSVANGTYQVGGASDPDGMISVHRIPTVSDQQADEPISPEIVASELNSTISVHRISAAPDQQVDEPASSVVEASEPDGTISVRRAPDTSARQAEHKVDTFGSASNDKNKRKKLKKIIAIASVASAACVALIFAFVLLPKIINRPALEVANGEVSSTSEESVVPVSSSTASISSSAPASSSTTTTTSSSDHPVSSSTTTTTSSSSKSSSSSTTTTTSSSNKPVSSSTTTTTSSSSKSSSSSTSTATSSSSKSSSSSTMTTTSSSSKSSSSSTKHQEVPAEPVETTVTILGVEYDIATTTELFLRERNITDAQLNQIIPQIKKLKNLKKLNLIDNQVSDLNPLATFTNLTSLYVNGNQISDITPLAKLTNLTDLGLSENQIVDITPLSGLTKLTVLNLHTNNIKNIATLSKLTNLSELYLNENLIGDITAISNLTNLERLYADRNQICDLTPLSNLTNLNTLDLWENQISNITPLAKLTKLKYLNLSDNQIKDITILAKFTNLDSLYLSKNQISNISPLSNLTNLNFQLDLSKNKITNITPLYYLSNLKDIFLNDNPIANNDITILKQILPNCLILF